MSTIGIISIKGGVGKTTTACNLGTALAVHFKQRVLVIDANFTAPNLGLHLGLADPKYTLHDVLQNKIDPTKAIYAHNSGVHIMPGSLTNKKIDPYLLKAKIRPLNDYYDKIILDSSPNLNHEMLSTMLASDELLVVSSPDYPTLYTTINAIRTARSKHIPIAGMILNRVRNKPYELSKKDVEKAADIPVLAVLPEDNKAAEALSLTTPVVLHAPGKRLSIQYKKLAGYLIGKRYRGLRL